MSMTLTGLVSGVEYTISTAQSGRLGDYDVATRTKLTGIDGANVYVRRLSAGQGVHMKSVLTGAEWVKFQALAAGDSETCLSRVLLKLTTGTIDAYAMRGYITDFSHEQFGIDVHIVDWEFEPALVGADLRMVYWPFAASLSSPIGSLVTFTRAAAKDHLGVNYGINIPIYDNGLYIGSDASQDTPKWMPALSTLRTIAMHLKQTRYPSNWVIGAGAGTANLLTANQSNAETDTTGMAGANGNLTRNTSTPLVGTGDFKLVATGGDANLYTSTLPAASAGTCYSFQALIKTSGCAAGRQAKIYVKWYDAADGSLGYSAVVAIDCPTTATVISVTAQAPATTAKVKIYVVIASAANGEILYADSLMMEAIPAILTVWTAALNKLTIDTVNNLLKWTDDTTIVSATFSTASYMAGTVVDAIVIDSTSHAVTVIAHATAGTWYTGTGTLAAIAYPEVILGNLEGSIANLTQYDYALAASEYQAL
jgi:hypothetical protein